MAKPEIRLKGFEGEWETTFLNDLAKGFSYGINAAAMPFDGVNKYLRITDIDDSTRIFEKNNLTSPNAEDIESYILQDGDITFVRTGASVGKSYIYNPEDGKVIFAGFLIRAQMKETVCPHFVYYNTLTNGYYKYIKIVSQRSGQPGVNSKEYGEYSLCLPKDKKEQQSIADYFKSLDSMIQGVMKKIVSLKQMKQACLVSMFPQVGETTPRVRFKGFKGEWGSTPLSQFSKKVTRKNNNLEYKITLTNSAEFGVINQLDFFDHDISNGDNIRGYYVVENDDFVYNPRISATAPVGPINRNMLGYSGVMSPLYYVFKVNGIDKDYLNYFFKTKLWHKFMKDNGNSGARFDRLSITDDVFVQMPIFCPKDIAEQKRIASFFRSLDSQISLQEQRLEKLKQIKSACLDKMFV
jgi:type I restriction enzyme S subunit